MKRSTAYRWLADTLCIPPRDAHIGMLNEEQCRTLVRFINLNFGAQ